MAALTPPPPPPAPSASTALVRTKATTNFKDLARIERGLPVQCLVQCLICSSDICPSDRRRRSAAISFLAPLCASGCAVCPSCVENWFATQLSGEFGAAHSVSCPACNEPLDYDRVTRYPALPPRIRHLYERRMVAHALGPDYTECPRCDAVGAADAACRAKGAKLPCPANCGAALTLGTAFSLKNYAWTALFTKPCPHCGISIQKNGGCPNMTCSNCGRHFRWDTTVNAGMALLVSLGLLAAMQLFTAYPTPATKVATFAWHATHLAFQTLMPLVISFLGVSLPLLLGGTLRIAASGFPGHQWTKSKWFQALVLPAISISIFYLDRTLTFANFSWVVGAVGACVGAATTMLGDFALVAVPLAAAAHYYYDETKARNLSAMPATRGGRPVVRTARVRSMYICAFVLGLAFCSRSPFASPLAVVADAWGAAAAATPATTPCGHVLDLWRGIFNLLPALAQALSCVGSTAGVLVGGCVALRAVDHRRQWLRS